jgi:hypothetical protein
MRYMLYVGFMGALSAIVGLAVIIWNGTNCHVNHILRHQSGVRLHLLKIHCV